VDKPDFDPYFLLAGVFWVVIVKKPKHNHIPLWLQAFLAVALSIFRLLAIFS